MELNYTRVEKSRKSFKANDSDLLPEESVNFITCAIWVPHGVAKENPEKVEISKEDLARLISETKGEVEDLEENEAEDTKEIKPNEETPMEVVVKTEGEETEENKDEEDSKDKIKRVSAKNDDGLDFEERYLMEDYGDGDEDEEEESMNKLLHLGKMTIHASNDDDPYVSVKDKDDIDSEDENHAILPSDNLIAVGHMEGTAALLEVYVYNAEQGCLYVHHDNLLPSAPLCMEWLNYDPTDEQLKPGNMVAIGSMSPVIEVWDLDLVDCLEPAFRLGKKGKKKKKIPGVGHKDAVLSLAWNTYAEHVLASGSVDKTVIVWDMQQGSVAQQLTSFNENVQSIKWHHTEPHTLLTGACDKMVRLFDCNDSESFKSWEVNGEVECVLWNKHSGNPYNFLASTDKGTVYSIDSRQEKPVWILNAHSDGCTGLRMSPECPGCLVTASNDETVKIWDIMGEEPKPVKILNPKLGVLQCLASCPDKPFVFCMGGDNKENNFKVCDIRQSKRVRSTFCSRVGLPTDEDVAGSEDEAETFRNRNTNTFGESSHMGERSQVVLLGDSSEPDTVGAKPKKPKKSRKKNSGYIEKRTFRK